MQKGIQFDQHCFGLFLSAPSRYSSYKPPLHGGYSPNPYKGLMGACGHQGMFFGIFVLNRISNLSFFVLIRVSIYQFLS